MKRRQCALATRERVHGESHIQLGSEAHLYTDKTFIACEEMPEGLVVQQRKVRLSEDAAKNGSAASVVLRFERAKPQGFLNPNPCSTWMEIRSTLVNVDYEIVDSRGAIVLKGTVIGTSISIDTSSLSAGSYTVRMKLGQEVILLPFTKI